MRTCNRCKEEKDLTDFYKHKKMKEGYLNICKDCKREYAKEQFHKNMLNPKWAAKEKERTRERNKRLNYTQKYKAKTEEQKKKVNEYKKRWIKKNPEKRRAHVMVGNALRSGKLIRQTCEICGDKKTHAHHEDYTKPLDVIWLCSKHHREVHFKE